MASGIAWMIAARMADRCIGVVSTLILTRLLVPGDFGLIAMAMTIAGILDLLGSFNFDLALIQQKAAERRHYDTVWTFNLLFGLLCAAALAALAWPASFFYREPRLQAVMYVLALAYVASAFSNVGVVAFRKELHFRDEFMFILYRRIVTFAVTVGLALWTRSYWALIIGTVVGRAVSTWLSYRMSSYRPSYSLAALSELLRFSRWLLLNNGLFFLLNQGPALVVGRVFGTSVLGIYSVAQEISTLPTTELVAPINRATFPSFTKMTQVEQLASAYLKLLGMISLIIVPIGVGISAAASPLVLLALGQKWADAIPLVALLALHGAITATQTNNGPVWMALGHPHKVSAITAIFIVALLPGLYFYIRAAGIIGIGYAYLTAHILTVPLNTLVTNRMLNLRVADIAAVTWRPLVGCMMMYVAMHVASGRLADRPPAVALVALIVVGASSFIASVALLWLASSRPSGAEAYCLDRLLSTARKA